MLGTTPEDIAQFLHQEERLDSVSRLLYITCMFRIVYNNQEQENSTPPNEYTQIFPFQ